MDNYNLDNDDNDGNSVMDGEDRSSMWRSLPMTYMQWFVPIASAHDCLEELGLMGVMEITDLNPQLAPPQRHFASDIKHLNELMRKITYLRKACHDENVYIYETDDEAMSQPIDVLWLDGQLTELEKEVKASRSDNKMMESTYNELVSESLVLETASRMFADVDVLKTLDASRGKRFDSDALKVRRASMRGRSMSIQSQNADDTTELLDPGVMEEGSSTTRIDFLMGLLPPQSLVPYEHVIFRMTRGNCVVNSELIKNDIEPLNPKPEIEIFDNDDTDVPASSGPKQPEMMGVVLVLFRGKVSQDKVRKVSDLFHMKVFDVAISEIERSARIQEVNEKLEEMRQISEKTNTAYHDLLAGLAEQIGTWEAKIKREIRIFHEMNKLQLNTGDRLVMCEGWCAVDVSDFVASALRRGCLRSGAEADPIINFAQPPNKSPTFFSPTPFSRMFYSIIEAYGIPRYKELNPTSVYTITFPLMFGVMFGDVGHGCMLMILALLMIADENRLSRRKNGEMLEILFGGRYVLLMLSLFAIYMGFLYNEIFSMSFDLFGTAYTKDDADNRFAKDCRPSGSDTTQCAPYVFGVDPVWKKAREELDFTNSLKMKLSILIGVLHMSFAILLSCSNAIHFRDFVTLINICVPRLVFFLSVFGYMSILIVVKWATPFQNTHCAPSVLSTITSMFLAGGATEPIDTKCFEKCSVNEPWRNCETHCRGCNGALLEHQQSIQVMLLCFAFISALWMLLVPPFAKRWKHNKHQLEKKNRELKIQAGDDVGLGDHLLGMDEDNEHDLEQHGEDFSEEFTFNLIHCFEFLLGSLSNTASYLRLWALSLAHSQLSTIFWEKCVVEMMVPHGTQSVFWRGIGLFVGVTVWMCATSFVLIALEGLSAFLHALRLHWVEFQNKHFHGDGRKLKPFDLDNHDEEPSDKHRR